MFLVGHAIVAFLIAYGIAKGSKLQYGTISFALVMLIATLPDIDIITQELGFMPHKTFTHSPIVSGAIISPAIFLIARFLFKQTFAGSLAYSLAFAQHMLDDIIIGTLNIAYPFGEFPIGIGINYGSLAHLIIEMLLLASLTAIIMNKAFRKRDQFETTALFTFNNIDKISYALLIASFAISFAYLLYEMQSLPRLFVESELEIALFALLHLAALALVSFQVIVSRQYNVIVSKVRSRNTASGDKR